jgi:hypothetical protein
MSNEIDDIESTIDEAIPQLVVPLRMSKELDLRAINTLLQCVDQLRKALGTSPTIPRQLAGKLWFVFMDMLAQADHTRAPEPIRKAAWDYAVQLSRLFEYPPGSSDPFVPGVPRY